MNRRSLVGLALALASGLFFLAVVTVSVVAVSLRSNPEPVPVPPRPVPVPLPAPAPKPCPGPKCPSFSDLPANVGKFVPAGPEYDGKSVQTDLPKSQAELRRNVGGSDGAGLCVFASCSNAADWQQVPEMSGLFRWMQSKPGGGYPEKLTKMIEQFCKEKGLTVGKDVNYIQITNGDEAFVEAALKARLMVSATYSGNDGVYYRSPVAHMVNVVYLDNETAAILDNNYPDKILWMSRREWVERWKSMQGGWAVVWLHHPPPPIPTLP